MLRRFQRTIYVPNLELNWIDCNVQTNIKSVKRNNLSLTSVDSRTIRYRKIERIILYIPERTLFGCHWIVLLTKSAIVGSLCLTRCVALRHKCLFCEMCVVYVNSSLRFKITMISKNFCDILRTFSFYFIL